MPHNLEFPEHKPVKRKVAGKPAVVGSTPDPRRVAGIPAPNVFVGGNLPSLFTRSTLSGSPPTGLPVSEPGMPPPRTVTTGIPSGQLRKFRPVFEDPNLTTAQQLRQKFGGFVKDDPNLTMTSPGFFEEEGLGITPVQQVEAARRLADVAPLRDRSRDQIGLGIQSASERFASGTDPSFADTQRIIELEERDAANLEQLSAQLPVINTGRIRLIDIVKQQFGLVSDLAASGMLVRVVGLNFNSTVGSVEEAMELINSKLGGRFGPGGTPGTLPAVNVQTGEVSQVADPSTRPRLEGIQPGGGRQTAAFPESATVGRPLSPAEPPPGTIVDPESGEFVDKEEIDLTPADIVRIFREKGHNRVQAEEALALINEERARTGLPPIPFDIINRGGF